MDLFAAVTHHIHTRGVTLSLTLAAVLCVFALPPTVHAQVFRGYSSDGPPAKKSSKEKRREVVRGYYPGGQLEFVATYRKSLLDGVIKQYYEDGMLKAEIPYDDGERDGIAKFYHENGMLMCKVSYEDNKERRAKFYDKNGLLTISIDVDRSGLRVRKRNKRRRAEEAADSEVNAPNTSP